MKIDFLTPSQLQYPGAQIAACQQAASVVVGGAFQAPARDGLFNSIFTPDDLPYPLPIIQESANNGAGAQSQSVPISGSTPSAGVGNAPAGVAPAAPASPAAPSSTGDASTPALPPQIIINVTAPAPVAPAAALAGGASPPTPTASAVLAPVAVPAPTPTTPAAPIASAPIVAIPPVAVSSAPAASDTIVKAYAFNPRLRARVPKAHEELLQEMLQEQITMRMLSVSSAPIAFVVPDGFNAVDFYLGAIEANPDVGECEDLDLIVTLGDVKLSANAHSCAGTLKTGDQITVTVPWRYASWVELAHEHLRVPVFARFYAIQSF